MKEELKLDNILGNIDLIKKIYDNIRIIDPIKRQVLSFQKNEFKIENKDCYRLFEQEKQCNGCISNKAFNENDTFVKIEYDSEKVYMITAMPIELNGRKVVLELLKDITQKGIIENIQGKFSEDISILLNNKDIQIMTDSLTNTYNKRYINEQLPREIFNSSDKNEHLSIILADIDYFKKVNDTYGHISGDYVLKQYAKILKQNIRKENDWAARFGGEEFLLCLPNTDNETAYNIAERIRRKIERTIFRYRGKNIKITSSFGVSTMYKNTLDLESFIDEADKNLYKAKQLHRNKVITSNLISSNLVSLNCI